MATKSIDNIQVFKFSLFTITQKKLFRQMVMLLVAVFLMYSCSQKANRPGTIDQGTIAISGAFALYPMTVKWAEEFRKDFPGIRIDISAGGAGKGMTDALSGMADLGMFSREVSSEEESNGAWKIAVTKDAVLCTINSGNPALELIRTRGVKKSDLQKLFLKDCSHNWNDFPG